MFLILTHCDRDELAGIRYTFSYACFNASCCMLIYVTLTPFLMRPVVNIPALIQATVWCWTCSKPTAMMTHSNDAHMRHHASMRKGIAFHLVCLFVIEKMQPSEIRALNRPDGRCLVCCWRVSTVNNHVHIYTKKYSNVRSREPVYCTVLLVMIECGQE